MSDIIELQQFDLDGGQLAKPSWSPNGRFLAVPMESGSIAILDVDAARVVQMVGQHSAAVTSVGWNREGEFIMTGSLDRSVGVWEVSRGRRTAVVISGHREPVHSVEWTDEWAFAITCSADRIRALDGFCLEAGWTREMEDRVNEHNGFSAASCSFQTTLLLALAAENGTLLTLTSLVTADVLDHVRLQQPVRSLAWSPREELLSVAAGKSIFAFPASQDGFKGSAVEVTRNVANVHAVAFSGDGNLLVSQDPAGVKVWDVKARTLVATLEEQVESGSGRRSASGIAFHPRKPLLATITPNGTSVRVLDLSKLA